MNFPWWDRKTVALFDQILFLPSVMKKTVVALPEQFNLELCSGNGQWIVDKALAAPDSFWIGVEQKIDRAKKIWHRAKRLGASNLLVVCGTAENFINLVLPEASASHIFINFPDPWPKRRHAKHRLMKEEFIAPLKRVLKKEGTLQFVTDDYAYLQEAITVLQRIMKPLLPTPHYAINPEGYGRSFFEELWRSREKTIHYTLYAH